MSESSMKNIRLGLTRSRSARRQRPDGIEDVTCDIMTSRLPTRHHIVKCNKWPDIYRAPDPPAATTITVARQILVTFAKPRHFVRPRTVTASVHVHAR